jgi:hypothetical protein
MYVFSSAFYGFFVRNELHGCTLGNSWTWTYVRPHVSSSRLLKGRTLNFVFGRLEHCSTSNRAVRPSKAARPENLRWTNFFFPEGGVGLVPKCGCLLKLAYYAIPRWYEFGERRWNDKLTGENRRTRRKTCPSATLSTTNPTWIDPGLNELRGINGDTGTRPWKFKVNKQ